MYLYLYKSAMTGKINFDLPTVHSTIATLGKAVDFLAAQRTSWYLRSLIAKNIYLRHGTVVLSTIYITRYFLVRTSQVPEGHRSGEPENIVVILVWWIKDNWGRTAYWYEYYYFFPDLQLFQIMLGIILCLIIVSALSYFQRMYFFYISQVTGFSS